MFQKGVEFRASGVKGRYGAGWLVDSLVPLAGCWLP